MTQDGRPSTPPGDGRQGPGEVPPLSSVEDGLGGAPGPNCEEPGEVFLAAVNDAAEVLTAIEALDVAEIVALPEADALRAWAFLEDANRELAGVRSQVTHQLAEAMSSREVTVDGLGVFVRHVRKDRIAWDKDDLLREVLDSRVVDTSTGEVRDETPIQKVLACWNLPAPRLTALRERGIDADQFCRSERRGFSIELIR